MKTDKELKKEKKKIEKRKISGEEVIFIFEKVLEGWKNIRIYNTLIQNNTNLNINKKLIEKISTGNCKIYENELFNIERYNYYIELREKVYEYHKSVLILKANSE
jgi:hypothetical protein